jgi:hypothetical protein
MIRILLSTVVGLWVSFIRFSCGRCPSDYRLVGESCVNWINRDDHGFCKLGYLNNGDGVCSTKQPECRSESLLQLNADKSGCVCVDNAVAVNDACKCIQDSYQLDYVCHKRFSSLEIERVDEPIESQKYNAYCGYGTNKQKMVILWFWPKHKRASSVKLQVFIDGVWKEELSHLWKTQDLHCEYDEGKETNTYTCTWNVSGTVFKLAPRFCSN